MKLTLGICAITTSIFHIVMQWWLWWWLIAIFIFTLILLPFWRVICLKNQKQDYLDYLLFCSLDHCSDCPYRVVSENTM